MVYAASAIILKDNKILLVKRSDYTKTFPKTWACPGGRGDEGETPEQAVVRELKEEVNIDFKPRKLFKTGKYKDRDLFRFLGDWSGNIKIQEEEITEYNWFSYEDAIKLDLGFDYKEVIEMLHKEHLI
ncbi:MAG: NUDIX hydrolase [Candidatus Aenigmarchaeota archaeon]|nr:NUDIX hydrolase [Candidatus Aenigmarchaeota archaeon]